MCFDLVVKKTDFSSFIGMSQTLPATAYIKMIDIWMIFTMLYPFAEIALVWTKDFFKKRAVTKQGELED